jgi:phosphatidylinositol 4-kinase
MCLLMRNRLCHLLISVDNESMALEEFIIDLCEESVNGALLVCGRRARWREDS